MADNLLVVRGLKQYYPVKGGLGKEPSYVKAVDNVDFEVRRGEVFGIVGESGCGKSTLGKSICKLIEPTDGSIVLDGEEIAKYTQKQMRPIRKKVQMVFQDPYASLNPRMSVRDIVAEPLIIHGLTKTREETDKKVVELLRRVGLDDYHANRYPHEFSGGQRQRIGIAKALSLNPKFIVCDEPVSALDVSIQAQILNLLKSLQKELHLTLLFVGHGLGAVNYVSDRIAVMYLGKIVEIGEAKEIFRHPVHPYTQALIEAVPVPDPEEKERRKEFLAGEIGDSANPPMGCRFHPRCPYATPECAKQVPKLLELAGCPGHLVACPVMAKAKRQRIGEARATAAGALTDQKGGRRDV